jgi:3-phenylpropionate/trans-cinnamate dioxygenase ferredoxin reductase subunit
MPDQIVIIGAGQAAQSAIETLRAQEYAGAITLIGDEPERPYQRPPLSKAYLLGDMARERLYFRPENYYADKGVALRLNAKAAKIDREDQFVECDDGVRYPYDRLLIATGAAPRRLPAAIGGDLPGVYAVRTLADINAMAPALTTSARTVIIGGGYIGLEAAAVFAKRGLKTTVLEREQRILGRVACAETAAFFTSLHASHGVDIRCGIDVERLRVGDSGAVDAVILSNNETLPADIVVVGVGVTPNSALATDAGLESDNGVSVNAQAQTSDEAIFAAGDCASFSWRGRQLRLESVQNAIDQGAIAAKAMLNRDSPGYEPTPWFWSDQYDVKLQIAGLGDGANAIVVRPGAREGAQSVWYFDRTASGEKLLALDAMNDSRAYLVAKRLLEAGKSPPSDVVANPGVDLKSLLSFNFTDGVNND